MCFIGIYMNVKKFVTIKIIALFCCSLLLIGCSANRIIEKSSEKTETNQSSNTTKLKYAGKQHAVTKLSESGQYRFTLYSKPAPIPYGKIHQWVLKAETKAGVAVTNTKLYVNGGMPAHRHGFPTRPVVKKHLGNGEYLVEGIKFTMPGYWEMRFTMKIENKRERVIFKINLY